MIQVKLQFFGAFRKYADGVGLALQLPENATVGDLRAALARRLEALDEGFRDLALIADSVFADESSVLPDSAPLAPDSTLAVLPPVSGG